MDTPFVATKVSRSRAHNDKWAEVLACHFESEEGKHQVVHLTERVAEQLEISKKSWPHSMRTRGS